MRVPPDTIPRQSLAVTEPGLGRTGPYPGPPAAKATYTLVVTVRQQGATGDDVLRVRAFAAEDEKDR